jgi:hypothetical protein
MLVLYPIPANPPIPDIPDGQGYLGMRVCAVEPCVALARIRWRVLHRRSARGRKKRSEGRGSAT